MVFLRHIIRKMCINKHKTDIKTHQKHRFNTIPIFKSIFFPRNCTAVHLFLIKYIEHFQGNSTIFAIFFAPCMVIDSCQKKFMMIMQLKQCFVRAKPFPTEKQLGFVWLFLIFKKNLTPAFWFSNKPSALKKSQNFKSHWQPCTLIWLIHNMVHCFVWKQVKWNVSRTVK